MAFWKCNPDKSKIPHKNVPDCVIFHFIDDGNLTVDINEIVNWRSTTLICDGQSYEINLKRTRYSLTRGLEPDKIVGITIIDEKLTFIMKWKNAKDGKVDFISAKEVYEKWPDLAFEYYQARLTYTSPSGEKRLMG
ncbi:uncharacterized protein LOC132924759 [Rhopalosiphum padi]|uniref:uncharacterized protein LOC132924759 n=1 Tax=Rhopalosiphum padi TaxID=40932 RepID=UPI00298DCCE4|nr:uncharacterized protein LOC132924759 [Rhopalosiphum padi]